ncbi:mitochondrial distribution and morphology protein 10 [Trichomonascus vanleenenianus]|uniref:Mdm10p n=1 Tax=Trichomonascus vanleenenianus TaxID=2268995 RepID=UPI003ECB15BD
MLQYMEYIQRCFYKSTEWNEQNSYTFVAETAQNLLDFKLPQGISLNISSQPTENSATSYKLSSSGFVNGSIAYLYSSSLLKDVKTSRDIDLHNVVSGYKMMEPLRDPNDDLYKQVWLGGKRIDSKDLLLYGRLFLPGTALEAMLIRRLSPLSQLVVTCVSDSQLKNNGAVTFNYQLDKGKYCHEFIYSTHESLFGIRSIFNFGPSAALASAPQPSRSASRLSMGYELYYGVSNKSPGFSTAVRYTSQSAYTGTPITMTLLANPLMGHLSATYALRTTTASAFASRFDFNVYSYLSDLSIGCEIWRKLRFSGADSDATTNDNDANDFSSVFKASTSISNQSVRLLWEGRFHGFLISSGLALARSQMSENFAPRFGLEVQFSS